MLSLQCKQERVALGKGAFLHHRHPGSAGHPSDLLEEGHVSPASCRTSSWWSAIHCIAIHEDVLPAAGVHLWFLHKVHSRAPAEQRESMNCLQQWHQ